MKNPVRVRIFAHVVLNFLFLTGIVVGYQSTNKDSICCDGVVGKLGMLCCGTGQVYNRTTSICCGSMVYSLPPDNYKSFGNYACCDSHKPDQSPVYNWQTSLCCGGIFPTEKATYVMQCCGKNKMFDSTKEVCCNGEVFPVPTGSDAAKCKCCFDAQSGKTKNVYDAVASYCCGGSVSKMPVGASQNGYIDCCYDTSTNLSIPYIWTNAVCCDGVTYEKKDKNQTYSCCGKKLHILTDYDKTHCRTQGCMAGETNTFCCGNKDLFDPLKQICANYYNETSKKSTIKVLDIPNSHSGACALNVYDKVTQGCCKDKIYNASTHVCCNNEARLSTIAPPFASCCYYSNSLYDTRIESCNKTGVVNLDRAIVDHYKEFLSNCGPDFPPNLPAEMHADDGYLSTNGTHICCAGKVGDVTMGCCGNRKLFSPAEGLCCYNTFLAVPVGRDVSQYRCCAKDYVPTQTPTVYDRRVSVCCNGVVSFDIPNNDTTNVYSCCYDPITKAPKPYDYYESNCCNGTLLPKDPDKTYVCCGSESIQIYYSGAEYVQACCGEQYVYNPKTQICASSYDRKNSMFVYEVLNSLNKNSDSCGLRLFDRGVQGCCNEILYSTSSQICCKDRILPLPKPGSDCCIWDGSMYNVSKQFCNGIGVSDYNPTLLEQFNKNVSACGKSFPPNFSYLQSVSTFPIDLDTGGH